MKSVPVHAQSHGGRPGNEDGGGIGNEEWGGLGTRLMWFVD